MIFVDQTSLPKRVMVFNPDGTPYKWFLGPTHYGGGGTMDQGDRSVVIYRGMKFRIDWEKRTWKLESMLGQNVERCIYHQGHRYLIGHPLRSHRLAIMAFERDGVAIPIGVAGRLDQWEAVGKSPALQQMFGSADPQTDAFVWTDRNFDTVPQPEEVQLIPGNYNENGRWEWTVGEDLSILATPTYAGDGLCLRPASVTKEGVPLYDASKRLTVRPPLPNQRRMAWGDDKGRVFITGTRLIDADGKTVLWDYPSPYSKHAGFHTSPFGRQRPPGVVNEEFHPVGHFRLGKEEFYVNNGEDGNWYCYTADGMLAGCLFGGPRGYGLKGWPAQWQEGKTDLEDIRLSGEHYQGSVVKANDGQVYAIAGHNHMSVVRIEGLEKLERLSGAFTVTAADLEKTASWQARKDLLHKATSAPRIATMLRTGHTPSVSGTIEEWPEEIFATISKTVVSSDGVTVTYLDGKAAIAYDEKHLYLAMRVRDESPMKNGTQELKTLFKGGDAADLTIGFDAAADPQRQGPVSGDLRLLFSMVNQKPVAVLYKPVDPNAPRALATQFVSPIGTSYFDRVETLTTAQVAVEASGFQQLKDGITLQGKYWTLEAAVPWEALGVAPPTPGTTLRGDFGYLQSNEHGTGTVGRVYWSGKSQVAVSDIPSEAQLRPVLWGEFVVTKPSTSLRFQKAMNAVGHNILLEDEEEDEGALLEQLEGLEE